MSSVFSSTPESNTRPYGPKPVDLMVIKTGLRGGLDGDCAFLAPTILPHPLPWSESLTDFLSQTSFLEPPEPLVTSLAKTHVALFNHYYLCKPLVREMHSYLSLQDGECAMTEQLAILFDEHQELQEFTRQYFHFSPALQQFLTCWIAATSPVMMMMGYPDAIAHAGQVARLCVVKAAEMSHSPMEWLQAAMVGWLHDPKFLPTFSLDNLCTHPIVAAAIADDVFQTETIQSAFWAIMDEVNTTNLQPPSWPVVHFSSFSQGVVDALSINNDSRYVMERFVLPKLELQIQKQAFENKHDPQDTEKIITRLRRITEERLSGPSQGKAIPPLPDELVDALATTSMDTGLVSLHAERWVELCQQIIPGCDPQAVYQQIIQGEWTDEDELHQLHDALNEFARKEHSVFLYWPIPAPALFNHHDDVQPSGKIAALSLACSDPILLSPHKVISTRPDEEPLLKRVHSYLNSLADNVRDLPISHQSSSQSWQRAILVWLLASADELTHARLSQAFLKSHTDTLPEDDIADLERILCRASTWGIFANLTTNQEANQPLMDTVTETIQRYYNQLCLVYRNAVMDPNEDESKLVQTNIGPF